MRTNPGKVILVACTITIAVVGSTLSGCSGCGGSTADGSDTTSTNGTMDRAAGGASTSTDGASASGHGTDGASNTATQTTDAGATATNATPLTPTEERTKTGDDMRGLRAILKAELDAVRARLGGTADAAAKEADKTRAAELAQGLERIDRAIKAIDEADDVSWGTIRESQLKEAGEVRAWMSKYGMNVSS